MADYPTSQLIAILRKILSKLQEIVSQLEFKNKNDSQRNEQESGKCNRATNLAISPIPIEVHSLPAKSDDDRTYQKEKRSRERKKFIIEIVTLIALSIYTTVAGIQACLTKRAIKDNETSFQQTLCQMKVQSQAQQNAASAAQQQARLAQQSLGTTIDQFHLDQRAWISIQSIQLEPMSPDAPIAFSLVFTNTGKTPATNVIGAYKISLDSNILSSSELTKRLNTFISAHEREANPGIVVPYTTYTIEDKGPTLIKETIDNIKSGKTLLYIWGFRQYHDVFKDTPIHTSGYCARYDPVTRLSVEVKECGPLNYAN